jgi:hypothetical protein
MEGAVDGELFEVSHQIEGDTPCDTSAAVD